jgi:hypothetical protein
MLSSSPWYYGFDGNEGNGIDLVSVLATRIRTWPRIPNVY